MKRETKRPMAGTTVTRSALPKALLEAVSKEAFAIRDYIGDLAALNVTFTALWMPSDQKPRNVFEEAIRHLWKIAKPEKKIIGVEYWLNFMSKKKNYFQPHYDVEGKAMMEEKKSIHPTTASILYLNAVGSPTAIFDIRSGDEEKKGKDGLEDSDNILVYPERNLYVTFEGNMLHGVIPVKDMRVPKKQDRITLLVNYWTKKPRPPYCVDPEPNLREQYKKRLLWWHNKTKAS